MGLHITKNIPNTPTTHYLNNFFDNYLTFIDLTDNLLAAGVVSKD